MPGDNSVDVQPQVRCRHCLFDIPAGANYCTHCKQNQSRFWNALSSISITAAAISVIGAALTYIVSTLPEVRRMMAWEEKVSVLQFTTRKGLSLANVGDGVVHVSSLVLRAKHPDGKHLFVRTIQIDKDLEKGKFLYVPGDDEVRKGKRLLIVGHDDSASFASSLIDSGDLEKVMAEQKCFLWVVYKADSPLLRGYKERMAGKLMTYPVTAELEYHSFKLNKSTVVRFDVVGLLNRSNEGKCATDKGTP